MKDVNKSVKNNESAKNDKQTVEQRTDSLLRLCYENANVILLFVVVIFILLLFRSIVSFA